MEQVDIASAADVAVLSVIEDAPGDVLPERCPLSGDTAGPRKRFVICDRPRGHSGDHWDATDERSWRLDKAEAVQP